MSIEHNQQLLTFSATEPKNRRIHLSMIIILGALWLVSLGATAYVFSYCGPAKASKSNNITLSEMLLSSDELKLGTNSTLINLQLKDITQQSEDGLIREPEVEQQVRKMYRELLQEKVKQKNEAKQDGFTVKPVPQ